MKHRKLLNLLGAICLSYWLLDFINTVLINHRPSWLLWYSSSGLFLTGIALVSANKFFISSMFSALFVAEALWSVDFLYRLSFHKNLLGLTQYAFSSDFTRKDFYMSFYHFVIPICLLIAVRNIQKVYSNAWIGAAGFASTIAFLTYFFTDSSDKVNCIHSFSQCQTSVFSFMFAIHNPLRIFVVLIVLVVLVYIPSNYVLVRLKEKKAINI